MVAVGLLLIAVAAVFVVTIAMSTGGGEFFPLAMLITAVMIGAGGFLIRAAFVGARHGTQ